VIEETDVFLFVGVMAMRFGNLMRIFVLTIFLFVYGFLSSCREGDSDDLISDDLFEMCGSGDSTIVSGEIDRNTIWKF